MYVIIYTLNIRQDMSIMGIIVLCYSILFTVYQIQNMTNYSIQSNKYQTKTK